MELPTWSEILKIISDAISSNQFFQGGAVLGILMWILTAMKSVPSMIWNRIERHLFYRVNIEEIDDLFYYFEVWLAAKYSHKYRNVEASVKLKKVSNGNDYPHEREDGTYLEEKVHYKQYDDVFYIRRGLTYIRINKGREKLENASNMSNAFYNKFELGTLFSKSIINGLIEEVLKFSKDLKEQERRKSIEVRSCNEWGDWIKESVLEPKSMDKVFLECKEDILEDIDEFKKSESWYKTNSVSYKRGYLFHGPPGNGKSTFIMSLAKYLGRSVNFMNLNNVTDKYIRDAFRGLKPNSLLILEDVDAAFSSRKGSKNVKFSFSTLLNCLDGIFSKEDIIVIFTTNHPEKLDDALIREGRVDKKFEFKNPSQEIVSNYLSILFNEYVAFNFSDYECKLPMVTVQNICLSNKTKSPSEIVNLLRKEEKDFTYKILEAPKKKKTKMKVLTKIEST